MSGTKLWRSTDQGWVIKKTLNPLFKKWKEYGTTTNLPREGRPPKLIDQASRALIREATTRPKKTLKELQSSTAKIGVSVHRTTLSRTLHRAGHYRRAARKKQLLKVFAKSHVGDSTNIWKNVLWSDETKIELFGHQDKHYVWLKPKTSCHPENTIPQWSMVVAASCCVDVFHCDWETGQNWRNDGWR